MTQLSFSTSICYPLDYQKSTGEFILETVESFLNLSGRKAQVIPTHAYKDGQSVCFIHAKPNLLSTAIKVFLYCSLVLPLCALAVKAILRKKYTFYELPTAPSPPLPQSNNLEQTSSKKKKAPAPVVTPPSQGAEDPKSTTKTKNQGKTQNKPPAIDPQQVSPPPKPADPQQTKEIKSPEPKPKTPTLVNTEPPPPALKIEKQDTVQNNLPDSDPKAVPTPPTAPPKPLEVPDPTKVINPSPQIEPPKLINEEVPSLPVEEKEKTPQITPEIQVDEPKVQTPLGCPELSQKVHELIIKSAEAPIEPVKEPVTIVTPDPSESKPFKPYTYSYISAECKYIVVLVNNLDEEQAWLNDIAEKVPRDHCGFAMELKKMDKQAVCEVKKRLESLSKNPSSLQFQFHDPATISICPSPQSKESLADGTIRLIYPSGVVEIENTQTNKITRTFPDGRKEIGSLNPITRKLHRGYKISADGKETRYINYTANYSLLEFTHLSSAGEDIKTRICLIKDNLLLFEQDPNTREDEWILCNGPINDAVLEACVSQGSIEKLLKQEKFNPYRKEFIDRVFSLDASGSLNLLKFSTINIKTVIEGILKTNPERDICGEIAALGGNLFKSAATDIQLLEFLNDKFPEQFSKETANIIIGILENGNEDFIRHLKFSEKRNKKNLLVSIEGLSDFEKMLWQVVVQKEKPEDSWINSLSIDERKKLYKVAFDFNNPYVHEPADVPVAANAYSVNLMWINKSKIPSDQEYLMSEDFKDKFIEPVSRWVEKSPGTPINIWIDSEMATPQAIQKSEKALKKFLKNKSLDDSLVRFRDVRDCSVVQNNPTVFDAQMPIYFRVDLLRAIAADHILSTKESQYFVYGDLDMDPLSTQELFDKKTVTFLDDLGFVVAKGGHLGFENGFQILNGANAHAMEAHRKVIIDGSIGMALDARPKIHAQQIYDTYPAMLTYLLALDGRYGQWINYNNDGKFEDVRDNLIYFRYDIFESPGYFRILPFRNKEPQRKIMPTKPVVLPPSKDGCKA